MPYKFHFRAIPFVAMFVSVVIGISLGQWQMRRAHEKDEIEKRLVVRESAPAIVINSTLQLLHDIEYHRVIVKGEFVPAWTVYLDNRPYKGEPGFYVLMPLKILGSDTHVLVARGWIKRTIVSGMKLPSIATPNGIVEIHGLARQNLGRVLQLGEAEQLGPNARLQNLDLGKFAQALKMPMQGFVLEQTSDTQDDLIRDWPRPSNGADKHRGYAFQWYALAGMAFVFFIVTGYRRGKD